MILKLYHISRDSNASHVYRIVHFQQRQTVVLFLLQSRELLNTLIFYLENDKWWFWLPLISIYWAKDVWRWYTILLEELSSRCFNHVDEALTLFEALSYNMILMVFREVLGDRLQYFTIPSTIHWAALSSGYFSWIPVPSAGRLMVETWLRAAFINILAIISFNFYKRSNKNSQPWILLMQNPFQDGYSKKDIVLHAVKYMSKSLICISFTMSPDLIQAGKEILQAVESVYAN